MKKIKVIGSVVFLFLAVACAYDTAAWLDVIALWGLIDTASGSSLISDLVITIVLSGICYTLIRSSMKEEKSQEILFSGVWSSNKIKLITILFYISCILKIISVIVTVSLFIANFIDSGICWYLLNDMYIPARFYIISKLLDLFSVMISPDLNMYEKEYTNKSVYQFITKKKESILK